MVVSDFCSVVIWIVDVTPAWPPLNAMSVVFGNNFLIVGPLRHIDEEQVEPWTLCGFFTQI